MTDEQVERLIAEARALVGTPFQHAGRNEHGLDCVGLLVLATRRAGMDVYDNSSYSPVVDSEYMLQELARAAVQKDATEVLQLGDVMLFRVGRSPQHLALVSDFFYGEPYIIHAYQTVGRVVEQPLDQSWRSRFVAAYEWRPS